MQFWKAQGRPSKQRKQESKSFFSLLLKCFGRKNKEMEDIFELYNSEILTCTDSKIVETLLFGDTLFNQFDSNINLNATNTFIVSLKPFYDTLFYSD